ncbi:hypothetical protein EIP75_21705 [Aquabacterium soli]|uniref:Uncharacterized protein n=1 Tax=Aquabacterium soli TaxID=2493092 RepID=A0A3R8RZ07_9BURK|nr:hypothetical protein EIP75_21705 [Aquabacterium soli]
MAGCASVAVDHDHITQRTAFALGIPASSFTISDRADSGVRTDYTVKTTTGKQYACYVTGSFGITGRVVSDAICSEVGKTSSPKPAAKPAASSQSCNALLKAAGKC